MQGKVLRVIYFLTVMAIGLIRIYGQVDELPNAIVEENIVHLRKDTKLTDFVELINKFYNLSDEKVLTEQELIQALKFQERELKPFTERQLKVIDNVIHSGVMPEGTEVNYWGYIKSDDPSAAIKSDILRITFGKKGLLSQGVRMAPNPEQAEKIFSLYARFCITK